MHLKNVSTVFTRALTTASATGFALLGSQADLDGMADVITKFKADAYVLDPRSFRRSAMHRIQDYFSLDIFLTLKDPADLNSFQKTWGEVRNLAITRSGILSFGMGIQTSADGKTVTAYFKEYFESADDFFEWEKVSAPYVKRLLDISSVATKPNPVAMTSSAAQLAKAQEKCKQLGCVQYTIDDCTSAADALEDTTLFVLPLYQLSDPSNKTATSVFREAYCDARTIGYKEDFTYLFNTAVVQGRRPPLALPTSPANPSRTLKVPKCTSRTSPRCSRGP
jgi:hypothetical protein